EPTLAVPQLLAAGDVKNLAHTPVEGEVQWTLGLPLLSKAPYRFKALSGKATWGGEQSGEQLSDPGPRLYQRASFSGDTHIFSDLVAYAPGMKSSAADIQGVLDAEAAPELANTPGSIDPRARRLIDRAWARARASGWQTLVIPGQ